MFSTVRASRAANAARRLRNAALAAFLLASCLRDAPGRSARLEADRRQEPEAPALTVVLVAVDGVRWQEVGGGVDPGLARRHALPAEAVVSAEHLWPNLYALADDGGALIGTGGPGGQVLASGPEFLSMPGYTEMLTGRRVTACRDNACREAGSSTLADEIAGDAAPGEVAVLTSWPDIGRVATRRLDRVAMSTGRNGGPTRGLFAVDAEAGALLAEAAQAAPTPGSGDFRPDRYTSRLARHYLEAAAPRFMFVALGEPDEYGHRNDYAGYLRSLRETDAAIGELARLLARRAEAGGRTLLLVTTDHGRGKDFVNHGAGHPESARVWLFAWGTALGRAGSLAGGPHHLADIAPTVRALAGLPPDRHAHAGRVILAASPNLQAPAP